MKVVQINPFCNGSTGKISVAISKLLNSENIENYILYTSGNTDYPYAIKYSSEKMTKVNALAAKIKGNYGFNSKSMTAELIKKLKEIKPDVVQLHNLHGHNVNIEMLFSYLKSIDVKIVWTFHDCWAFTGYCMYFDYTACNKWMNECCDCCQKKKFTYFFDRSKYLFNKKKELFTGFKDLTIVTPSEWLAELVKKSFLKEYPVRVINNGINLDLFKPMENNIRERLAVGDKKILLCVAMGFSERKGLKFYIEMSKMIDPDTVIVLVGLSKEQISILPDNIIGMQRTSTQQELAELYTASDVFVNCTLEDNFPTVNLESIACGTPVVTFKTGGSPEAIDESTGAVVEQGDVKGMLEKAYEIMNRENISELCRKRALELYDDMTCFAKYVELYKEK